MSVSQAYQAAQPLGADGPALGRILRQAGLEKTSVVRVTGPAGLTAALWLCRHGFVHAAYVHARWVGTMRSVDALVAPHATSGEELRALLEGASCLREGGVLIAQMTREDVAGGVDSVAQMLASLGFEVEHRLSDKGRHVCIARRVDEPRFKKAA
jgi:hypothetical protein